MIPLLAPVFTGSLRKFGARLSCDPDLYAGALPLAGLLQHDAALDALLARAARRWGSTDLRAVASAFTLDYFAALLPPAVVAASVLRLELPLMLDQVRLISDDGGRVSHICLPHGGAAARAPTPASEVRYETLVWRHLDPLITVLARRVRLAPRVLWSNAIRRLHAAFDRAAQLAPDSAMALADHHALTACPSWPDGRDNPLHHRAEGKARRIHRQCCLYHDLPGETFCAGCPLSAQQREHAERQKIIKTARLA